MRKLNAEEITILQELRDKRNAAVRAAEEAAALYQQAAVAMAYACKIPPGAALDDQSWTWLKSGTPGSKAEPLIVEE